MWKTTHKVAAILAAMSLAIVSTFTVADEPTTELEVAMPEVKEMVYESERELHCMAEVLYYEARGEGRAGQLAVAQVVLNRVAHPLYPDSICDVVYHKTKTRGGKVVCQFSWVCDRKAKPPNPDGTLWQRVMKNAYLMVNGQATPPITRSLNFHATHVQPAWAKYERREAVIGNHAFYR